MKKPGGKSRNAENEASHYDCDAQIRTSPLILRLITVPFCLTWEIFLQSVRKIISQILRRRCKYNELPSSLTISWNKSTIPPLRDTSAFIPTIKTEPLERSAS